MLPGIILGVIILADIRWVAYAGILWVCYSFYVFTNYNHYYIWSFGTVKRSGKWFVALLGQALIAILIASPLLFPLIEYIYLSTRSILTPADVVTSSLPLVKLFGLIIPNFWGYAEEVIYQGELSILILIFIFIIPELRKKQAFWLSAIIVSLLLALGSNIPIFRSFFLLPGINLLRVPSRFLFIMGFSFSFLLAAGIDYLIGLTDKKPIPKAAALSFTALCGLMCFLSIGVWIIGGSPSLELSWGSIFLIIFTSLIILIGNKISATVFIIIVLPLLVLDLAVIDISEVQYKTISQVESEKSDIVEYLSAQPGLFRIYSPSYSMPQQIGALNKFQLADGIDPMQMKSYVDFMELATGVPVTGYSVTLPSFNSGNPAHDNEYYSPNFHLLGFINVGFVVSEFPIAGIPSDTQPEKIDNSYIYKVSRYPRAWVQLPSSLAGEEIISEPDLILKPNQIILEKVKGPGLLVLSEIYYPGWKVSIDGQKSDVKKVFDLFRGVDIASGTHRVVFSFQPIRVYLGLALAMLTWFGITLYVLVAEVRKW